jgi:peptidoglycan/xylan/chitin deacetylase (PgdA/CDA1 family)
VDPIPDCTIVDEVFVSGSRAGNRVALTFDLCPRRTNPAFQADVVDFLERRRIPATFFASGAWAQANPESLARLASIEFFEIGLHGDQHRNLADATDEQIVREIEDGRAALLRLGVHPQAIFRPPYAEAPSALGRVARSLGVIAVTGDAALGDPNPLRNASLMQRDGIRWIQAGSLVILHANGGGRQTRETLEGLTSLMLRRGYEFVRVSDLVSACA